MIGNNIKEFRAKKGLTQKDLANLLFVTPQAVSRWENEESEPSTSTLVQLAQIFGVSVDCILGLKETEKAEEMEEADFSTEESDFESDEEDESEEESEFDDDLPAPKSRPVLALCEKCNSPIYRPAEMFRWTSSEYIPINGRITKIVQEHLYCRSCNQRRQGKSTGNAAYSSAEAAYPSSHTTHPEAGNSSNETYYPPKKKSYAALNIFIALILLVCVVVIISQLVEAVEYENSLAGVGAASLAVVLQGILSFISMIGCPIIASRKNRSVFGWFLGGVFLGFLGLIIVSGLSENR